MAKEIFCVIGVDVDAVAGWLGSYGGEDSPDDISRGIFAGEVGTRRLLKMFDKYDMKTTWFIPGHSIETFPEETKMVVDAGHEVGMHGYSHENPIAMTPEQEEAVLVKCIDLIEQVSRPPPDRLRRALVGVLERHQRAPAQARDQVRPQPDAPRLRPVLRAGRRLVDEDRLLEEARGVDEAARPRRGDRPDRDPGELVPRRPPADDVHQGRPEQPRLRQPAAPRGDLARPVRLRLPRGGLRRLRDDDPPGRERPTAGDPDARAADRVHLGPRRRPLGDDGRDRRRLQGAASRGRAERRERARRASAWPGRACPARPGGRCRSPRRASAGGGCRSRSDGRRRPATASPW